MNENINFIRIRTTVDTIVAVCGVNPYKIASKMGIPIKEVNIFSTEFKAQIICENGNLGIMLNKNFDTNSKYLLLAHELGHAFLHRDYIMHYADTNISSEKCEIEANFFAYELMCRIFNINTIAPNKDTLDNCYSNVVDLQDIFTNTLKVKEC